MTLAQILFGHAAASARPTKIKVLTDDVGAVFIPRFGEIHTGVADSCLELAYSKNELRPKGVEAVKCFSHAAPALVEGSIEVCACGRNTVLNMMTQPNAQISDAGRLELVGRHFSEIQEAVALIRSAQSCYFESIATTVQRLAIFESECINSFATMACHGMVFINAFRNHGVPFFVEEISHQCGHAVFSAWTNDAATYLSVPPEASLRVYTGRKDDRRTVYEAFHGIFTEAAMVACLGACLERQNSSAEVRVETLARLGFILRRFGTDLHDLACIDVFAVAGERILESIIVTFRSGYEAYWNEVREFDYSNQGYVFDLHRFYASNFT